MPERHSQSKLLRCFILVLLVLFIAAIRERLTVQAQVSALSIDRSSSSATRRSSTASGEVEMQIVRVGGSGEGELPAVPGSTYSSFNLDSTRFLIEREGRTAIYTFDPTTLAFSFREFLFNGPELEACHWSTLSSHTVFGVTLSKAQQPQIVSYDVDNKTYSLVKDFSGVLPPGSVGQFSKSRTTDDKFAFAWRESNLSPWRYIVIWNRTSDSIHVFDIFDRATAVSGYRDAYLNDSGNALVVRGDVTRVWNYMLQPQESASWVDAAASVKTNNTGSAMRRALGASDESWNAGPRNLTFDLQDASESVWDVLPYKAGNGSRDGRFFIFDTGDSGAGADVFIAKLKQTAQEAMDEVTWINAINCTAVNNTLEKTAGENAAEDAGAMTIESVEDGDGFIEFAATDKKRVRSCGFLSEPVAVPSISDFDYAIQLVKKKAYAYEKGIIKARVKYHADDTFRLAIEGDVVKFYLNGRAFYTSGRVPAYPLFGAASLVSTSSSVAGAVMGGGKLVPRVRITPSEMTMIGGQSKRFEVSTTGLSTNEVNWSASKGTVTSDGVYTAPLAPGTYTLTATSITNPSAVGSAAITVSNSDVTPPFISNVFAGGLTSNSAIISWSTDEPADSQADYGSTSAYGLSTALDESLIFSHSTILSGLSPNTVYHYRVKSRDGAGNLAASVDFTFTTLVLADSTPPLISGVSSSGISSTGATISWTTNELSDSQVDYGLTIGYGASSPLTSTLVTLHSAFIGGLSPSTTYHYRVRSRDAAGNLAASGDFTFTTTAAADTTPPIISAVSSSSISSSAATIAWTTNEASTSQVEFGTTSAYGSSSPLNSTLVAAHSVSLSGLSASTLYHYRVKSRDAAGNLAVSGDFTFNTQAPPDTTPPAISAVSSSGVSSSAATITWTTNEASDSQVDFGTTTGYGSSSSLITSRVTSHSASLSGLSASTLYHYRVKSRDAAGNLATSGDFTFTTQAPPDTTPPVISGVGSSGVTSSAATINWTTNEASNTQVDYGTTTSYGSSSPLNTALVTSHSASLNSLSANTLYHYRVKSRDAAGNLATSRDFTFTTQAAADTTPPVISGVGSSGVTSSAATINWTTNEPSNTQVDYGTTTSYGSSSPLNSSMVTSHSASLSGLSASTTYHYRVKSRDAAGNLATSGDFTLATQAAADTTPPVISGVGTSGVTSSAATINWTTNEASNTQVDYGTTTSYGSSSPLNSSMVTSHSVSLSGLSASTTYHYRVKSRDAAGNLATSGDFTLATQAAADTTPPVISGVGSSGVTSSAATINWTTNEASNTQVDYGTTTSYGSSSPLNSSMVTSHSAALSGLAASTTYHYRVKSRDAAGNLSTSGDFTFTTTASQPPPSGPAFYVAPNGSPSANGSIASPWDLQTALSQPAVVQPGATIYLRGGTYNGSFTSTLTGTSASRITVRSYPGEWAIIDSNLTTTLNGSIDASTTTITLANAAGFRQNDSLIVHENQDFTLQEEILLGVKNGNTFTGCRRGNGGTTAASHSSGIQVVKTFGGLTINGQYTDYRDFEHTNSLTDRSQNNAETSHAPYERGRLRLQGPNNRLINLRLHDGASGILSNNSASGTVIYGCTVYNNGYRSAQHPDEWIGHGMYLQNTTGTFTVRHTASFGNYLFGTQFEAVNGNAIGARFQGYISFNNGAVRGDPNVRTAMLLIGANNGQATDDEVTDSYFYNVPAASAGVALGYTNTNGSIKFTGNHVYGGAEGVGAINWSNIVFTGNHITIDAANPFSNTRILKYVPLSGSTVNWNNNTYRNTASTQTVFNYNNGNDTSFATWKSSSGVDASSSYATSPLAASEVFVIPNEFETGRGWVIIYNWGLASSVNVDLSMLGLTNGQGFSVYNSQRLDAPPLTGTFNGGSPIVNLSVSTATWGTTATSPIGSGVTIAATWPRFMLFEVRPIN